MPTPLTWDSNLVWDTNQPGIAGNALLPHNPIAPRRDLNVRCAGLIAP
jgi:hypothetical protein